MEEPNIDKNVLGKLIQYYRTKKKISRNDIVENNNCISFSTLKRLENGNGCKLIQYEKVCLSLNIGFSKDIEPYNEINHLLKSTLAIINSGKPLEEYLKIKEELFIFNNKYKDFIYLNDLSLLGINVLSLCIEVKIINYDNIKMAEHVLVSYGDKTIEALSSYLLCTYAALFLRIENYYRKYLSYHKGILT